MYSEGMCPADVPFLQLIAAEVFHFIYRNLDTFMFIKLGEAEYVVIELIDKSSKNMSLSNSFIVFHGFPFSRNNQQ